jgi:ATP-dependent helicase/nuclease subunit B
MPVKHVFTIAPGAPFLKSFVAALLDGRVVAQFSRALGPLDMAQATIYVPTRRAARALAEEFAEALDRPACLLPRILPLGGLEATETRLLFEEPGLETPLNEAQAASDIWRRMQLAVLVQKWALALRHAIVSVGEDGSFVTDAAEPCLVGTSAADAWHLAGELAGLIDELIIEDVAWERLDPLVLPEFDPYWRITLDFLNIAISEWPSILAKHNLVDAARFQNLLVEAQIERIAGSSAAPVIAIGSTGTNRATARLLAAVAAAPQGAVVLPGLDLLLDKDSWQRIGNAQADEPGFAHPQAALRRLLPILGVNRDGVIELGHPTPARTVRDKFLSEALRPADTTDMWSLYREQAAAGEIATALDGVSLIEAADEREEALSLAIALRQVLETPDATGALVTPDRDLARRVAGELGRFGIEIDDSAGEPLSASPYGTLARLILLAASSGLAAKDVVALLVHPLTRLGLARVDVERLAPLFEIGLLRQVSSLGGFAAPAEAIAAARSAAADRFAHPAQKRITVEDWARLEDLLTRIQSALAPLSRLSGPHQLGAWIDAHRAALDAVTQGRAQGDDVEALETLLSELHRCALPELRFDAETYALFLAQTMAEAILRRPRRVHPRLKIFGLLEARLMDADVMLLGGLDEAIWPPQATSDAFLNRPMRSALGLTPPERKIGQTAHDFVMAMGHERVVLSCAMKRDGTPSVASRFVQRLAAVGGKDFEACRQRGKIFVELARTIDYPATAPVASKRPMPRPPIELRPARLSVTRIETLRRDPYAIYAEFILQLAQMPLPKETEARRNMGNAIHEVLANFATRFAAGVLPPEAGAILAAMMQAAFKDELADPDFAIFQWPRIERAMRFYLDFEARRRPALARIDVEIEGTTEIPLADGTRFTLSAKADRLEHLAEGGVTLVDYKTGAPPSPKEVRAGFAPQLTLEAAMARRGAFGLAQDTRVDAALYVKLLGKDGGEEKPLRFKKKGEEDVSLADMAEKHFADLVELLNQFRDPTTPYPPRPFPKFAARYNAYDHLARVKEWASGEGDGE